MREKVTFATKWTPVENSADEDVWRYHSDHILTEGIHHNIFYGWNVLEKGYKTFEGTTLDLDHSWDYLKQVGLIENIGYEKGVGISADLVIPKFEKNKDIKEMLDFTYKGTKPFGNLSVTMYVDFDYDEKRQMHVAQEIEGAGLALVKQGEDPNAKLVAMTARPKILKPKMEEETRIEELLADRNELLAQIEAGDEAVNDKEEELVALRAKIEEYEQERAEEQEALLTALREEILDYDSEVEVDGLDQQALEALLSVVSKTKEEPVRETGRKEEKMETKEKSDMVYELERGGQFSGKLSFYQKNPSYSLKRADGSIIPGSGFHVRSE